MKAMNICSCLNLDSFGVELSLSKSKTELACFFCENDIPVIMSTETQAVIKSKLLSLDIVFYISFQFSGEKLLAVTMSPDTTLEGKSLMRRFGKIQKALENELGYPYNRLMTIIYLLDSENSSFYWLRNGMRIEHYLLNRFGIEEIVSVKL